LRRLVSREKASIASSDKVTSTGVPKMVIMLKSASIP
jgi:hypothetical protein